MRGTMLPALCLIVLLCLTACSVGTGASTPTSPDVAAAYCCHGNTHPHTIQWPDQSAQRYAH